jgi:hypothetical protein
MKRWNGMSWTIASSRTGAPVVGCVIANFSVTVSPERTARGAVSTVTRYGAAASGPMRKSAIPQSGQVPWAVARWSGCIGQP